MKKQKMILNIGKTDEKIVYFDNFTKNRLKDMQSASNYILLYYDNFFKRYIAYDDKTTSEEKAIFNNNLSAYC